MKDIKIESKYYLSAEVRLRKEFYSFKEELDDLVQEGLIGFFEASLKINPKLGSFFTYCYIRARWRALDHLRKVKKFSDNSICIQDEIADKQLLDQNDGLALTIAEREFRKLSKYHQNVVERCVLRNDGKTTPATTVRRVTNKLLGQLTESMN